MRIVVCAKEVLDPDAVNNYALAGRLEIGDDGKSLTQTTIPRLMNGYDEQALEAALRLRDAGAECRIGVVSVGADSTTMLKHAAALGADELTAVPMEDAAPDYHVVASLLAAWIRSSGNADLVLCGRRAGPVRPGPAAARAGPAPVRPHRPGQLRVPGWGDRGRAGRCPGGAPAPGQPDSVRKWRIS